MKTGTTAGWMKHENNPVLGGEYGTCFDISVIQDEGIYKMYFSWRPKKSLALTESKDGINWSEPVIVLGPRETEEGWEDELNRPVVVKREGKYHMWYTGQYKPGAVDGKSWIFYATSEDGVEWQRKRQKPVLIAEKPWEKVAVMCPHVIWDDQDNLFKMWYSGGDQYEPNAIGYATSIDGENWNKYNGNPIFKADAHMEWEQHKVGACQVLYDNGWYIMFYIGYHDEDYAQIGLARSRDGISNWERHGSNPIISPDLNNWDGDACYKPVAVYDGEQWLLWYNGRKNDLEQIGLAVLRDYDLGFE